MVAAAAAMTCFGLVVVAASLKAPSVLMEVSGAPMQMLEMQERKPAPSVWQQIGAQDPHAAANTLFAQNDQFGYKARPQMLSQAALQKLWGFNMGYEHHEQPPIFFGGSARGGEPVSPAAMATGTSVRSQMLAWGWPQERQKTAHIRLGPAKEMAGMEAPVGDDARPRPTAARGVESGLSKSKLQKLWMFNMGYEHHEQPPIYFGSARRSFTPVI